MEICQLFWQQSQYKSCSRKNVEFSASANEFYKNRDDSERISGEIWGKVEKTSENTRILSYYVTQSKLIDILNKKGKSWNAIKCFTSHRKGNSRMI